MIKEDAVDRLREFLDNSECSPGIIVPGIFNVDRKDFLSAFEHFLETGENVLDELWHIFRIGYDIHCDCGYDQEPYFEKKDRAIYSRLINNEGFWNIQAFLDRDEIDTAKAIVEISNNHDSFRQSYPFRRKAASRFISNPKIRKTIFDRDGLKCKKCGATDNLHLDHIKPVSKGGDDSLDNLQVLCCSCNSSKGNTMPDTEQE